tara:strand:+ start:3651 stop:4031 length:381 start_codon:yes stop_codon:yes gene_type:complete
MKDEIITLGTAKLAKEKGFSVSHRYGSWIYDLEDEELVYTTDVMYRTNYLINNLGTLAPSQSLLQRWLREEKGVDVFIHNSIKENHYDWSVYSQDKETIISECSQYYISYEVALEDGLIEALSLIE